MQIIQTSLGALCAKTNAIFHNIEMQRTYVCDEEYFWLSIKMKGFFTTSDNQFFLTINHQMKEFYH